MLFLLPQKLRVLVLLFLFVFLIGIANAFQLGVSPGSFELDLEKNERVCKDIKIYSDFSSSLELKDYWNLEKSRLIDDYKAEGKEFEINVEYPFTLDIGENGEKVKICFSGKKEGKYYGLLLFTAREKKVGVGVWITMSIGEGFEFNNKQDYDTSVSFFEENFESSLGRIMVVESSFLLFLALFLLIIAGKKSKNRHIL